MSCLAFAVLMLLSPAIVQEDQFLEFSEAGILAQVVPQEENATAVVEEVAEATSNFHRALVNAARKRVRSSTSLADKRAARKDLNRIRVAMLSPAFRQHAEDMAVIQLAASGEAGDEKVPMNETGQIDRANIDWDGIIAFIEKLIPLIVQLINIFGGLG